VTGWRSLVLRLMRVPHDPAPPPGAPPRVFRAARNYFTVKVLVWAIGQLVLTAVAITMFIVLTHVLPADKPRVVSWLIGALVVFTALHALLHLTFGYMVMRLDYELRWYMISDRAIRIREGISTVREKTIALANIQNISVKQGPIQRLLGIADVEVQTAGGGTTGAGRHGKDNPFLESMHVGYFRGVDNADEIRDIVREGVRRQKNAGLGDPDDHHDVHRGNEDAITAAQALLAEARMLRGTLARHTV
jgi:membrane protein YdbS with pleckstrin-like domain